MLPQPQEYDVGNALDDLVGGEGAGASITLLTALVVLLTALSCFAMCAKEALLVRGRNDGSKLGSDLGFTPSWRNYAMITMFFVDAFYMGAPSFAPQVRRLPFAPCAVLVWRSSHAGSVQIDWYTYFPLKEVSRAATLAGVRSVLLFACVFAAILIIALWWMIIAVVRACKGRCVGRLVVPTLGHDPQTSRLHPLSRSKSGGSNRVAPAGGESGMMSVQNSAAAASLVVPTKASARLNPKERSGTGRAAAWARQIDAEQTAPAPDAPARKVSPDHLSSVTADALFVYLLGGPLLVPGMMVAMAPFVCGFPFGPSGMYVRRLRIVWCPGTPTGCVADPCVATLQVGRGRHLREP